MNKKLILTTLFVLFVFIGASTCLSKSTTSSSSNSSPKALRSAQFISLKTLLDGPKIQALHLVASPVATTTTTTTVAVVPASTPTTTTPPAPVVTTTTVTPPTTTTAPPANPSTVSTPSDYDHRWDSVARCEEGGWGHYGFPAYPDSLGINAQNWAAYGGGSDLSPANQVRVAQAIEASAGTPNYVPDQGYCAAW